MCPIRRIAAPTGHGCHSSWRARKRTRRPRSRPTRPRRRKSRKLTWLAASTTGPEAGTRSARSTEILRSSRRNSSRPSRTTTAYVTTVTSSPVVRCRPPPGSLPQNAESGESACALSPDSAVAACASPDSTSAVVGAEREVVQRHDLLTTGSAEVVVVGVVAAHGVRVGPRLLGRLDPDVAVTLQAGAGGDQLADDHVLLQAHERVRLGVDRRVGQHPGRLLEGGRRQPRLG